jgi:hypothetical protein
MQNTRDRTDEFFRRIYRIFTKFFYEVEFVKLRSNIFGVFRSFSNSKFYEVEIRKNSFEKFQNSLNSFEIFLINN